MRKEILVDFTPMQLEGCGEIAEALNYANFIFSWASDLCKRIWPYIWLYYLRHGVIYWIQPRYYNPLDPEPRMFSIQFFSLRAKCKDGKLGGDRSGILTIRENLTIKYTEQEPSAHTPMEKFYRKVCEVYVVEKFRTPLQMASYLHKDLLREVVGHIESGKAYREVISSILELYTAVASSSISSLEDYCNMKFFCAEILPYLNENNLKDYPMIKRTEKKIRELLLGTGDSPHKKSQSGET
ncbi:MAG: hypothetical protein QW531_03740 [Thermoplasmata archaeon]